MKVNKFSDNLAQQLCQAMTSCANQMAKMEKQGQVYAFCIYSVTGCTNMGVAAQTLEALDEKNKGLKGDQEKEFLNQVSGAEWNFVFFDSEKFGKVNGLVDEFYNILFDGEFEDVVFDEDATNLYLQEFADQKFCDAFVKTFSMLKEGGFFNNQMFCKDTLLGLQYADPTKLDAGLIEYVSKHVNSKDWHNKISELCMHLRLSH